MHLGLLLCLRTFIGILFRKPPLGFDEGRACGLLIGNFNGDHVDIHWQSLSSIQARTCTVACQHSWFQPFFWERTGHHIVEKGTQNNLETGEPLQTKFDTYHIVLLVIALCVSTTPYLPVGDPDDALGASIAFGAAVALAPSPSSVLFFWRRRLKAVGIKMLVHYQAE